MISNHNPLLAADECAVAFSDGGGTCGRPGGTSGGGGGGRGNNCGPSGSTGSTPGRDPQQGCNLVPSRTGGFLCNSGANAIRHGQSRTEAAINQATGGGVQQGRGAAPVTAGNRFNSVLSRFA